VQDPASCELEWSSESIEISPGAIAGMQRPVEAQWARLFVSAKRLPSIESDLRHALVAVAANPQSDRARKISVGEAEHPDVWLTERSGSSSLLLNFRATRDTDVQMVIDDDVQVACRLGGGNPPRLVRLFKVGVAATTMSFASPPLSGRAKRSQDSNKGLWGCDAGESKVLLSVPGYGDLGCPAGNELEVLDVIGGPQAIDGLNVVLPDAGSMSWRRGASTDRPALCNSRPLAFKTALSAQVEPSDGQLWSVVRTHGATLRLQAKTHVCYLDTNNRRCRGTPPFAGCRYDSSAPMEGCSQVWVNCSC
jgi:hypothetical protein